MNDFCNTVLLAGVGCLLSVVRGSTHAEEPVRHGSLVRMTDDGLFKQRPTWSPDGKTLAFSRHTQSQISIWLLSTETGTERRLTERDAPEYDAVWHPDGKTLYFAFDKTSPNQGDIEVYSIGLDGGNLKPVAASDGKLSHEESPAVSPDGKWIAYTSTRDGNQELYVAAADGSNPKRLTSDPAIDAHPCFSPDGGTILFATNRWGDLELASIGRDGSHLTRITDGPGLDDYPAWSPDGKQIAWTSNRDRNLEIYVSQPTGAEPRNFSRHPGIDNFATYHPDGRLTFISNRNGEFEIYMGSK